MPWSPPPPAAGPRGGPDSVALDQYDTFCRAPPPASRGWHLVAAVTGAAVVVAAGLGSFHAGRQLYAVAFGAPGATARGPAGMVPDQRRATLRPLKAQFRPMEDARDSSLRRAPRRPLTPPPLQAHPLTAVVDRLRASPHLSAVFASALGVASLCLLMPEMATAEAAAPFMSGDVFRGVASSIVDTIGDAQRATATFVPAGDDVSGAVTALGDAAHLVARRAQDLARLADGEEAVAGPGPFGLLVNFVKESILTFEGALDSAGVPQSAGLAITAFTLLIKGVTFPLNYQQMASTTKIQALQPTVKALQERYKANPQDANQEIARLYKKYNINPLAALLPIFVQIPIFLALYNALRDLANANLLDQPFLFLPSLEGPTFGAGPGETTAWLTSGQLPPGELAAYVALPVILTISQFAATALMKVPGQETPAWVNYLPLITGGFSLNVPSGLSLYWVVNNFVTTATSLGIRQAVRSSDDVKQMEEELAKGPPRTFAPGTNAPPLSRRARRAIGMDDVEAAAGLPPAAPTAPSAAATPSNAAPTAVVETDTASATETTPSKGKGKGGKGGKKKRR